MRAFGSIKVTPPPADPVVGQADQNRITGGKKRRRHYGDQRIGERRRRRRQYGETVSWPPLFLSVDFFFWGRCGGSLGSPGDVNKFSLFFSWGERRWDLFWAYFDGMGCE